jgi:hypothetical protein
MITGQIAKQLGRDLGLEMSASAIFRAIAEEIPAYSGLRYPALKDESRPVQIKHEIRDAGRLSVFVAGLREGVASLAGSSGKNMERPRIGHKLHRLTVMTSKTDQFHLLAHGNPKPDNLLVSPLIQFHLDGTPKADGAAEAAAVGLADRAIIGVNK